ncbi:hypothetical protein PPERSA_04796 [Pseudocohnilembus persalinus]|uniref:Transmembrane protein n=1 Tax=Pseudocohnilembus persalinus TaxID=266149 RepID=A0A0V0QKY5_PSEPJ|nr:hypothetical protein PPERSA_04796 [Pseudocohnilembus persalinus]|eukprot:KRX03001.1 hypothetical protein PPERSA_04796 [Pseudocohnilembus persalinus]
MFDYMENLENSSFVILKRYQEDIYNNDKDIDLNFLYGYPGSFSNFNKQFVQLNSNEVCEYLPDTFTQEQVAECNLVDTGILRQGVKQAFTSVNEQVRDMEIHFNQEIEDIIDIQSELQAKQIEYMNSQQMDTINDLTFYTQQGNIVIQNNLFTANDEQTISQKKLEYIKFSCLIVVVFIVFFFAWMPYLKSLNKKIWMTKGILGMIPIDVILKNKLLLEAFMKGDIIRAVR